MINFSPDNGKCESLVPKVSATVPSIRYGEGRSATAESSTRSNSRKPASASSSAYIEIYRSKAGDHHDTMSSSSSERPFVVRENHRPTLRLTSFANQS